MENLAPPPKNTAPTSSLLSHTLEPGNLFAAWEKVRANDSKAGVDGQNVGEFEHNVFARLLTLKHQVERLEYTPHPLLQVLIPKPDGKQRQLAVPAVRDRILQTAVTRIISPILDREFDDASFAYRAGRSVPMAVARVAYYRDQGYHWVVDADIQTFFDEIDHRILIGKLRQILPDASLIPLIELWLAAILQPKEGSPILLTQGVPQGSPLSPLLSNLYLDSFDEALTAQDMRLVRFADDFLILCRDRSQAEQAMELTEELLAALKLELKPEKTRITHFEEGFQFLGVDFIRNLLTATQTTSAPWVIPDAQDNQCAKPKTQNPKSPKRQPSQQRRAANHLKPSQSGQPTAAGQRRHTRSTPDRNLHQPTRPTSRTPGRKQRTPTRNQLHTTHPTRKRPTPRTPTTRPRHHRSRTPPTQRRRTHHRGQRPRTPNQHPTAQT